MEPEEGELFASASRATANRPQEAAHLRSRSRSPGHAKWTSRDTRNDAKSDGIDSRWKHDKYGKEKQHDPRRHVGQHDKRDTDRRDYRDYDRSDRRDADRRDVDRRDSDRRDGRDDKRREYRRDYDMRPFVPSGERSFSSKDFRDPSPPKDTQERAISEAPSADSQPLDEEDAMKALMGFGGFDSTKGKHVVGADASAADVHKKRKYRQYMNRRGGFNRPLDKI